MARNPPPAAAIDQGDQEGAIQALKARAEDQAGEIARLKAALAAFEQTGGEGGLKNSKMALRARVGSAEAQAERQAATIGRLRAELAAANERLARQAAHFMDEMSRIGAGSRVSGQARRATGGDGRRKLVERVAQVRPSIATDAGRQQAASTGVAERPNGSSNGHGANPEHTPHEGPVAAVAAGEDRAVGEPAVPVKPEPGSPALVTSDAAPEMPQTAAIPEPRKSRLLDRITGLAKT
jgi:hypothetical protein